MRCDFLFFCVFRSLRMMLYVAGGDIIGPSGDNLDVNSNVKIQKDGISGAEKASDVLNEVICFTSIQWLLFYNILFFIF